MDNPVTHRELEQFKELMESENDRLKEENDRQNHRIYNLEESIKEISNLTAATQKLADNMENMLKVQEQQSNRLAQIESRDGEKWRKAMAYIGTALLGAVLAIVLQNWIIGYRRRESEETEKDDGYYPNIYCCISTCLYCYNASFILHHWCNSRYFMHLCVYSVWRGMRHHGVD